ncbi:MAG: DUF2723 domain-containing protein [Gemmatimonadota bacterium]
MTAAPVTASTRLQIPALAWWGAGLLCLVIGFADLVRGGMTLAPILLVIAYAVCLPFGIMAGAPNEREQRDPEYRPAYLPAALAGLAAFALYVMTLAPSTAMWDTSEYMSSAFVFGVPHPPGNPFFILLGRTFSLLPIAGSVAVRINLLAAVCSAASAGLWFLVTERLLLPWFNRRGPRIAGAAVGTLIGATAFTVWNQSVVNEKVYTIALLGVALIAWTMLRWVDAPDGRRADHRLLLVAYLLGLGYANHMAGMLAAPAVGLAVIVRRPATLLRWRVLLGAVAMIALGLTPFLTQPIRSAFFPAVNTSEINACPDGPKLDCTLSSATYERFMGNFNRSQYGKPDLTARQAPLGAQMGMWWLYFKWQWLRDPYSAAGGLQSFVAILFFAFGLLGAYAHWRTDRRTFWFFGGLMFTMTLALIYYLNFKYGYSQSPELGATVEREVRDRDYFYLWSFSAWGVWAGLGLMYLWKLLAGEPGTEVPETSPVPGWRRFAAAPILALALIPLIANWRAASRAGQTFTRDWAADLLNSVEPYGVLITNGDNDTYPLWYAQEVEGIRRDVTVAVVSLLQTDWYVRQLIRRPVYEYDAARGPELYRGRDWPKPTGSPLKMTMAQADAIPLYVQVKDTSTFQKDSLIARVPPGYLTRDQLVLLQMIKDSFPARGIFFSSPLYGRALGLDPYLVEHGFAQKLLPRLAKETTGTVTLNPTSRIDLASTLSLWKELWGTASLIRQDGWVDRASIGIPYQYISTGALLTESLSREGRAKEAAAVLDTTRQLAHAAHLDSLLGSE